MSTSKTSNKTSKTAAKATIDAVPVVSPSIPYSFNKDKVILVHSEIRAPRPIKVKDTNSTVELQVQKSCPTIEAMQRQLSYVDEKGKVREHAELQEVVTITNSWKSFLNNVSFPISLRGGTVISIHQLQGVKERVVETNNLLREIAEKIIAQLPAWKEKAIAQNSYIEGKFPTPDYFRGYGLRVCFCAIADEDSSGDLFSEIENSTKEKISESLNHVIAALTNYASGNAKKFTENSIKNLMEAAKVLRDSQLISGEKVDEIVNQIVSTSENFNAEAFRDAKESNKPEAMKEDIARFESIASTLATL